MLPAVYNKIWHIFRRNILFHLWKDINNAIFNNVPLDYDFSVTNKVVVISIVMLQIQNQAEKVRLEVEHLRRLLDDWGSTPCHQPGAFGCASAKLVATSVLLFATSCSRMGRFSPPFVESSLVEVPLIEAAVTRVFFAWYQLMLCEMAKKENIIVYLETGMGKTLIAILLMEEFSERIKKPGRNVCVFLAPTVPLVEQQAEVIRNHSDFKVGQYYGEAKHSSHAHQNWIEELEKYEILVMTPDILLHNLHHCFMKTELIELLIFDECHHAQKRHSYAQIMKEFFKKNNEKRPRIFGMTASPIMGK
ncbi:hypothetical protein KI387_028629, partial [Taxus chinensis]